MFVLQLDRHKYWVMENAVPCLINYYRISPFRYEKTHFQLVSFKIKFLYSFHNREDISENFRRKTTLQTTQLLRFKVKGDPKFGYFKDPK